jgi:hypothetical protein
MDNPLNNVREIIQTDAESLAEIFSDYYGKKYSLLNEKVESSRYAVEINYKTTMQEASFGFAKIALGYVSAALKRIGYHVKMVFSEKPLRVIISSRNWDDGEWVGMISYNSQLGCFILSKGTYNRMKKSVNVSQAEKIDGDISASEMSHKLKKKMEELKDLPCKKQVQININLKRGPKT